MSMNILFIYTLKALRKIYLTYFTNEKCQKPECEQDPDIVSNKIYQSLMNDSPCMIARFGANELAAMINYLGVKRGPRSYWSYIRGNELDWWWNDGVLNLMHSNAGFFPPTVQYLERFCELMIKACSDVDILGSWLPDEAYVDKLINSKAVMVRLLLLEPFWATKSWTSALEGKKVLVVHPFSETIQTQYKKRSLLFKNNILPKFELKTIKAVQSIAGNNAGFSDWFSALDYMKNQIDKHEYDICLIGCGAYGFPLAAHVKKQGKKSIHLGGSLQLLFGIRGKRWEKNYSPDYDYSSIMNEHWVRPNINEQVRGSQKIEDRCYW